MRGGASFPAKEASAGRIGKGIALCLPLCGVVVGLWCVGSVSVVVVIRLASIIRHRGDRPPAVAVLIVVIEQSSC
jgi:hypothetical protein